MTPLWSLGLFISLSTLSIGIGRSYPLNTVLTSLKKVEIERNSLFSSKMAWIYSRTLKLGLPLLWLSFSAFTVADVITPLHDTGMIYNGKTSGVRYLSFLGDTENKLTSTSFASLGRCPLRYKLGSPCVTFKLAKDGQLDDMDHHPGERTC